LKCLKEEDYTVNVLCNVCVIYIWFEVFEIISRISMAKAAFNKKTFDQQIGLKLKGENRLNSAFGHSFVWC
jgi:hypothetical protein